MIDFLVKKINSEYAFIIAQEGDSSDFTPAQYPGNGWPYIITFEEILNFDDSYNELKFLSSFSNTEMNGSNSRQIGYDNFTPQSDIPAQIPPYMSNGSLRFTGIPYLISPSDFSHTNILVPGRINGLILINHPNIELFIKPIGTSGNVHWGPEFDEINQNHATPLIIGTWEVQEL